jgi:predicted ABC-type ATPase
LKAESPMPDFAPSIVVIAGPNGAGKSTAAPSILKGTLAVSEFVNADVIALGLSAFEPETVGFLAGRVMLSRLKELARQHVSFGFETTLASRTFVPWITHLLEVGYTFRLVYLWLPSADFAIDRVAARVRLGGHSVPESTVRRRYARGLENFRRYYRPLATHWRVYNNSRGTRRRLIASGRGPSVTRILDATAWQQLSGEENDG